MKYYISKKDSLWRNSLIIKNGSGVEKYTAKAKSGFNGDMELRDSKGKVRALIKRKFSLIVPVFSIWIDEQKITDITKKISLMADYKFSDLQWEVLGDMRGFSYRVTEDNNVIFNMGKENKTWGDTYYIEIENEEEELLSICVAIALHKGRDSMN